MALVGAARRLGIVAKAREVRGVDRVVVMDGDAIGALLTRLGAHESVLAWEERRVRREVRATANRRANFDDANVRRSTREACPPNDEHASICAAVTLCRQRLAPPFQPRHQVRRAGVKERLMPVRPVPHRVQVQPGLAAVG